MHSAFVSMSSAVAALGCPSRAWTASYITNAANGCHFTQRIVRTYAEACLSLLSGDTAGRLSAMLQVVEHDRGVTHRWLEEVRSSD